MATESAAQGESLVFHPLDQFKITRLFGEGPIEWYTPTNATLWMALAIITITVIFVLGSKGRALIPTRMQSVGELAYGFIYKMVEDVVGHDGAKYFPMIMTLFIFILTANFLESDCTDMLFVDADIVVDAESVLRLLALSTRPP